MHVNGAIFNVRASLTSTNFSCINCCCAQLELYSIEFRYNESILIVLNWQICLKIVYTKNGVVIDFIEFLIRSIGFINIGPCVEGRPSTKKSMKQ